MWTVGSKAANNRVNRSQQSSTWLEQSTLKLQQLVREQNTCVSLVQHLTLACIYKTCSAYIITYHMNYMHIHVYNIYIYVHVLRAVFKEPSNTNLASKRV